MTDHRKLQRALFRMQVDPTFARAVFAREDGAVASTGLQREDLALLLAVDPRAVAADPGDRRRTQILGNAASEYPASLAVGTTNARTRSLLHDFAAAPELHAALVRDEGLPLAFGDYAGGVANAAGDALLGALVALERALVLRRRRQAREPRPAPDELALSGRADVLSVPAGTHAAASALRTALERGSAPERPALGGGQEQLLLLAAVRTSAFRLPEIGVERLEPPADKLFARLARGPLGAQERERFATAHGAELAQLDGYLQEFVAEGALVRG